MVKLNLEMKKRIMKNLVYSVALIMFVHFMLINMHIMSYN